MELAKLGQEFYINYGKEDKIYFNNRNRKMLQ